MSKIFVSFDLDGTIIKPDYNNFIWFKEIPQLYAKKYKLGKEKAKKLVMEEYQKVGEDDLRWYILQYWLDYFGFEVKEKGILQKYQDKVEVYEESLVVLDELYGKYPLVVATAMPSSFVEVKVSKDNLSGYFERIFSSISDFNMIKKEASFYEKVCSQLKISPKCLIHVGDNYQADYLAPRRAGARAFYLDRTDSRHSTESHIVPHLLEFIRRLKRLEK